MERPKLNDHKIQEHEPRLYGHLRPDVQPIMACLDSEESPNVPELSLPVGEVDLYSRKIKGDRKAGFLRRGKESYTISPINNYSKFSTKFINCTGLVVVGIDSQTKENISFMSHQNPGHFLWGDRDEFVRDLDTRLIEMKDRCEPDTIDVVIFGGQFVKFKGFDDDHEIQQFVKGEYVDSIKILSKEVKDNLGFNPTVVSGPKFDTEQDSVAFSNNDRRLFVARSGDGKEDGDPRFAPPFDARDIDEVSKKWTPGEIDPKEYLKEA